MKILSIKPQQAEMTRSLLMPELIDAIKKDLPVTALVAVENGRAVGAIGGAADDEIFRILSIFVHQNYRNRGIGKALVGEIENIVESTGMLIRAEYTRERSDHESLKHFFSRCGYREDIRPIPGYYIGYVSNLVDSSDRAILPELCRILPFSEVSEKALEAAEKTAREDDVDVPEEGLFSEEILRDISHVVLYDGEVYAFIVLEQPSEGMLTVEALYSRIKDRGTMLAMITAAAKAVKERYSPDTKIAMLILNKETDRLMQKVLRDAKASSFTFIK